MTIASSRALGAAWTVRARAHGAASPHGGLSALALALALAGCAGSPKQVQSIARSDLGCDQVTIAEIAKNRYAASGCAKGGVYAQLCGEGQPCSWVRLRGAEPAQGSAGGVAPAQPREIIAAPPPEQRQVIQAPPPAQREIIPAPPPAAPESSSTAPVNTTPAAADAPQQTSLANGDLSDPYQAQVPLTPAAQQVAYPPPAPLLEERPPPPAPSYQWVGGYWNWSSSNWLWAPGYWTAPMYGYNYLPGSWYFANNYWYYGPGGWARPNSTYIAYGAGPRPYGYAYTRSFTPRVQSAYPGRVGSQPVQQGFGGASSRGAYTPQRSPLYGGPGPSGSGSHYPSSATSPLVGGPSRMGAMRAPAGGSFGGSSPSYSAPGRSSSGPTHSDFRAPAMGRAPASSPAPSFAPSRAPAMQRGGGGFGGGGGGPGRSGAGPMRSGGGGIRR